MGYLAKNNVFVIKKVNKNNHVSYPSNLVAKLSSLGRFGRWLCIIPATIIVVTAPSNSFFAGLYFILATKVGSLTARFLRVPVIKYYLSAATLFVNVILTILIYIIVNKKLFIV